MVQTFEVWGHLVLYCELDLDSSRRPFLGGQRCRTFSPWSGPERNENASLRESRAAPGAPRFRGGGTRVAPVVRRGSRRRGGHRNAFPWRPLAGPSDPRWLCEGTPVGNPGPAGSGPGSTEPIPARPRTRPHLEVTFLDPLTAEESAQEEAENPTWLRVGVGSRYLGVATEANILYF